MREIIESIFNYYGYSESWQSEDYNIVFYKNNGQKLVSYFLINYIACRDIEDDESLIKDKMMELENGYAKGQDSSKGIKWILQNTFDNKQEASQLDKNTSAIYLLEFSDSKKAEKYRNLIYSIEESPYYFKRYILPYSENQKNELRSIIDDYNNKSIVDILTDLANNEDEYYNLLEHNSSNRVYELVIRLFSKVPFLQYGFKAEPIPMTLEKSIELKLDENLMKYHNAMHDDVDLEELIALEENYIVADDELEKKINRLLGGEI